MQANSFKFIKQMTNSNKQLAISYMVVICLLIVYTLTSIKECEAYWMHDVSILITKEKILYDIFYLFILPLLTIIIQIFKNLKTQTKLLKTQFILALISISLLLFAINKPCENINDGHYMFINSIMTLGYYLLYLSSFIIVLIIIIKTIRLIIIASKLNAN